MPATMVAWTIRCAPGLSVLTLLVLVECALNVFQSSIIGLTYPTGLIKRPNAAIAQTIFLLYSLFLHLIALLFPIRLCHAVWRATNAIQQAQYDTGRALSGKEKDDDGVSFKQNMDNINDGVTVTNVIMIPAYKEDIEVLGDTLKVLASHQMAKRTYDVFLAMEARDPNSASVAMTLVSSFRGQFRDIQYTTHPADLEGEAPGKSSNISWAAKEVQQKYAGRLDWKNVLLTVMDSDTHLMNDYFCILRKSHIRNLKLSEGIDITLYMPPIVFDRNSNLVPRLVRSADLMWCGAGLSCYQHEPTRSGIGIPTSVYTVTLPLVCLTQGWDTGPGAIGEDMHMMLKSYFATKGKLLIESIPSPASQCNVSSDEKGLRGWILSHRARYTQGLRHMWGSLDTGYAISQWARMNEPGTCTPPNDSRKFSPAELEIKLLQHSLGKPALFTWRNGVLLARIFEAHFLPIHLMIVMFSSTLYTTQTPIVPYKALDFVLGLTNISRAVSFIIMVTYFFVFYERYHTVCVEAREAEMRQAGLYEEMEESFSHRSPVQNWRCVLDYLIFPIAGTMFGSLPLLHATFSHFRSERLVYTVSAKPTRGGNGVQKKSELV